MPITGAGRQVDDLTYLLNFVGGKVFDYSFSAISKFARRWNGRQTYAGLAPGNEFDYTWSKNNYGSIFRSLRNLPDDYEVHHTLPQEYEHLFNAAGINIHEPQWLVGFLRIFITRSRPRGEGGKDSFPEHRVYKRSQSSRLKSKSNLADIIWDLVEERWVS